MSRFNTLWALASKSGTGSKARLSVKDENGQAVTFAPNGVPTKPGVAGFKAACADGGKGSLTAKIEVNGVAGTQSLNTTFQQVAAVKFIDEMFNPVTSDAEVKENADA